MVIAIARQLLDAALAAGHVEVMWWGGAAIAALLVVLVAGGTRGSGQGRRPTRRAARAAGLTRGEARVLQHLARAGHLRQESELFRDRALLDGVLQRGAAALRGAGSADGAHYRHRLAVLLSIKARVAAGGTASVRSLSPFQEGERITLTRATMPSIETSLLAGFGDELACALPQDQAASPPLRAGMQITVRSASSASAAGAVVATVLGRAWVAGRRALLVTRRTTLAGTVRPRGGRRRCQITPLTVAPPPPAAGPLPPSSGAPGVRRGRDATVAGTLVSLDAQWAGVRSVAPVAAGRLVRLVLDLGKAVRLPLYGKVVQSPRRGTAGVMLVHLTGLSRSRIGDLYRFVDECWSAAGAGRRR